MIAPEPAAKIEMIANPIRIFTRRLIIARRGMRSSTTPARVTTPMPGSG
jgi:hypothetical protein